MNEPKPNFVRLSRPSQPVITMRMEPTEHGAKVGPTRNCVRLSRPSPTVTLEMKPVEPPVVMLLEIADLNGDFALVRERLVNVLKAADGHAKTLGATGLACDLVGENGVLALRLASNDSAGAKERLTHFADLIASELPDLRLTRRFPDAG